MPMLLGLNAADSLDKEIDGFLLGSPNPGLTRVRDFLSLYSGDTRKEVARRLVERGVDTSSVSTALAWSTAPALGGLGSVLVAVSGAASAYHGYKRNQSIGWGVWWFFMGSLFPVITPAIGLAQGFGKRKA